MITVTPDPTYAPPRVHVELDAGTGKTFTEVFVYRDGEGLASQPAPGFQTGSTYDYEAPRQTATVYSVAYTLSDASTGVESVTTVLDSPFAYLIHRLYPSLSMVIDSAGAGSDVWVSGVSEVANPANVFTFQGLGRARPIVVVNGDRMDDRFTLTLSMSDLGGRDTFRALTRDQTPLLLRSPAGWGWDLPDGWYSVGDLSTGRYTRLLSMEERTIQVPLTRVDAPTGVVQAARTYGDLLTDASTYNQLALLWPTYFDLLVG